jgi:hypothetical protein
MAKKITTQTARITQEQKIMGKLVAAAMKVCNLLEKIEPYSAADEVQLYFMQRQAALVSHHAQERSQSLDAYAERQGIK